MKWHHENVTAACLSTNEVHKAPGDPQDKLVLLKIFKTTKEKYQETKEKYLWDAVRFLDTEHDAKRITAFGLVE